jgi:hypothetical protein
VGRRILFLDFDGVICDSIDECFVSSWLAYHRRPGAPLPSSVAVGMRGRFAEMRPFIRSGEDYVVIQRLLAEGRVVSTQAEFDAALAAEGETERIKEVFYAARGNLLETDRAYWLSLNRVYREVRGPLARIADSEDVRVLSTKKSEFIVEILAANGISMPIRRVIYTGSQTKMEIIAAMIGPSDRALLIDDQIDHLLACADPRVEVRLALWGYIRPEWPRQHPQIPTVGLNALEALLAPWLTRPRRAGA